MLPTRKISDLEKVVVAVSLIILTAFIFFEYRCSSYSERFSVTFSIITGILTGLISAISLLFFQEKHYQYRLRKYYMEIAGVYERIDIGQDKTDENGIKNMISDNVNVGLKIELIYEPEHSFKIKAEYWKSKNGFVEATIEFNEKNGMFANGRYRYTRGENLIDDSGIYTIYRLEEDKTKLLVLYQKLFPRKLKDNTDSNKGWEIWKKK